MARKAHGCEGTIFESTPSNHKSNAGTGSKNTSLILGLVHSLGVAEEWPVEDTKTKFILVALVVIVIVVASIGFYLIKDGAGVDGITALEGRAQADEISKNWNPSAKLVHVMIMGETFFDGRSDKWGYSYSDGFAVTVFENGSYYSGELEAPPSVIPVINWSTDSDEAYQIAQNNSAISRFLSHSPDVYGFFLSATTGEPVWYIEWTYDAGHGDYKWANIEINATTGEVLYVEADN